MDKDLTIYLHFSSIVEEKNWETNFSNLFQLTINQVIGKSPKIISNLVIPEANLQNPEESDHYLQSQAVIIILNNYQHKLSSKELQTINNILNNSDKDGSRNIFVVQRFNKKNNDVPPELQKFPFYSFFEVNPKTQEIIDFNLDIPSGDDNQYLSKLTDLVYDIKEFLNKKSSNNSSYLRSKTIYLAEVSNDQLKNRDKLRRSLMLFGYRVLPITTLTTSEHYETKVKENLEESILSINILGELYGESPAGSDYSFQELQNRYFQDIWKIQQDNNNPKPDIRRIIWLPPQLEPFEDKQVQYLKRINREINNSENTELIQSTLSDLKILVDQKIKLMHQVPSETNNPESHEILVIADDYYAENSMEVEETLKRKKIGFHFLNDIYGKKEYNQFELMNRLNKFNTYLVINTQPDQMWISGVINLLARSKGYEGSIENGHVGLFLKNQKTGFDNLTSLSIDPIVYNNTNLSEKLELFISNVKL